MQGTARHAHEHAIDLDTTLDFVNTLEYCSTRTHEEYGGVHEALRTPADATAWLLARDLLHEDVAPPTDDWAALGRVREVRAAFRELVDASVEERAPTPESVETVNELLGSRQVPAIEATADGVRLSHRHIAPPVDEALAGLADALVTKLASEDARAVPRLRQRRLSLGLLRRVTRRPPALVRHDHMRQPGQGGPPSRPREGRGQGRRLIGRRRANPGPARRIGLQRLEPGSDLGGQARHRFLVVDGGNPEIRWR